MRLFSILSIVVLLFFYSIYDWNQIFRIWNWYLEKMRMKYFLRECSRDTTALCSHMVRLDVAKVSQCRGSRIHPPREASSLERLNTYLSPCHLPRTSSTSSLPRTWRSTMKRLGISWGTIPGGGSTWKRILIEGFTLMVRIFMYLGVLFISN